MTTKFEDLTSLVDGIRDTFVTSNAYQAGTLVLGYNGSVFPIGVNIKLEIPPTSFQLSFVPPADSTALMIIYEVLSSEDSSLDRDLVASNLPPRHP